MKKLLKPYFALTLLSFLALSFWSVNARPIKKYSIKDFLATINYGGASFSKDNSKILVSNNRTGIFNVYSIPTKGGKEIQLTHSSKESVFSLGYFPDDDRFLFTSDQGGNELNHIYVRQLDGTDKDITPGDSLKASFLGWANDGRSFFIATNERDKRFFDVYEVDPSIYNKTMLFKNDEGLDFSAISPDRQFIALTKSVTNSKIDMYLFNTKTKQLRNLSENSGNITFNPQTFTPDGNRLLYLTDENDEFTYLMAIDLRTNDKSIIEKVNWDVQFASYSKKGDFLVVGINNDAKTELKVYNSKTMKPVRLPSIPKAEIDGVSFSDDETHIAFYASSSRLPRDLFVLKLGDKTPKKLTSSLSPVINANDLVEAKVVRFKSFDGVEIPGILYKPLDAANKNKVPALVWVHGGPGGQSRLGYNAFIQYLVNHDYAVYAINNRGSSGYGKTFFKMDDRKHGEGDLSDCVSSKKMLSSTGYVDSAKIGIIGGSYGGFMTLAALTFRPTEFVVGVDLFGVSNWVRTLNSIPPYWESFRKALEVEMGEAKDTSFLKSFSPLFHADKIVRPLMVLQGANDPRVLKAESDEIVDEARKNNVPVEYMIFNDEGHGLVKKENQQKGYEGVLNFLDKYLKGSAK